MKRFIRPIVISAVVALGVGAASATASSLITSAQIKDGTITSSDIHNGTVHMIDLTPGVQDLIRAKPSSTTGLPGRDGLPGATGSTGNTGPQGPAGPQGPQGDAVMTGAYYSVAYYDSGDTNAGAIATVACKKQTDTAISGGVQTLGLDEGANARNTPVSSSFPGRMDWSQNKPFANRLDGWIVQFGGAAGQDPLKVKVYALCVPGLTPGVEQTYTESDGS